MWLLKDEDERVAYEGSLRRERMSNPFTSFKSPLTKTQAANAITHDTIDEIEALRKGGEDQPPTPEVTALMERLSVLMTGPHAKEVQSVVRQRWPQMASLLDRQVGIVRGTKIQTLDGHFYDVVLLEGDAFPDEAQVTFLPSDDGMARNIQVIT
jgi:hypothetical protein